MALLRELDDSKGGAFGYERSQKGHGWSVRELAENLAETLSATQRRSLQAAHKLKTQHHQALVD